MHAINIKVDEEIYNKLRELAKQDDRSLSKYILRIIKLHAIPTPAAKQELPKLTPTPVVETGAHKYAGLTGDALCDAMDEDSRKDYAGIASG